MSLNHLRLRKGRHSSAEQVYLVTFTTRNRSRYFHDWDAGSLAARVLSEPVNWGTSRLLAWVLMPDHWHGLIEIGHGDCLANRIGWIKGHSSRQLQKLYPGLGRIWAPAYHDRALRRDEEQLGVARYVVMNPVRAGLASRVGLYPFWDAIWV